jgi:hypothetical protein
MRRFVWLLVLLVCTTIPVHAQDVLEQDHLTAGALTETSPTQSYLIQARAGQTLAFQVVSTTPGLGPEMTLFTAVGTPVQTVINSANASALEFTITLPSGGIFRLEVSSVGGMPGQFVLLMQEAEPEPDDTALALDTPLEGVLLPGEVLRYAVPPSDEARYVNVRSDVTPSEESLGLLVDLLDEQGQVQAALQAQPEVSALLVPADGRAYTLLLSSGYGDAVTYLLELLLLDGPAALTATPNIRLMPTQLAGASFGECRIASTQSVPVNIRRGPSTQFGAFMALEPEDSLPVTARNRNETWYQVETGREPGWVAASVTVTSGDCDDLPVETVPTPTPLPPTATLTPSLTPTPEPSPTAPVTATATDPFVTPGDFAAPTRFPEPSRTATPG